MELCYDGVVHEATLQEAAKGEGGVDRVELSLWKANGESNLEGECHLWCQEAGIPGVSKNGEEAEEEMLESLVRDRFTSTVHQTRAGELISCKSCRFKMNGTRKVSKVELSQIDRDDSTSGEGVSHVKVYFLEADGDLEEDDTCGSFLAGYCLRETKFRWPHKEEGEARLVVTKMEGRDSRILPLSESLLS